MKSDRVAHDKHLGIELQLFDGLEATFGICVSESANDLGDGLVEAERHLQVRSQ
jgi:hypothetical protein